MSENLAKTGGGRPPVLHSANSRGNLGSPGRSKLARHLVIVLLVKVVLLTALWHAFIKPNKIKVDVEAMGSRIAGTPYLLHEEEKAHDRLERR